jgi:hypothetical protein
VESKLIFAIICTLSTFRYYPVPFESGIANGFAVGKKLIIHGTPEKKAKRFNVNILRKNGFVFGDIVPSNYLF